MKIEVKVTQCDSCGGTGEIKWEGPNYNTGEMEQKKDNCRVCVSGWVTEVGTVDGTPISGIMNERPHVYQNREDGYHISNMFYCPVCNGFYGVSHDSCASRSGCPGRMGQCACRYHQEMEGKPREGRFGWIVWQRP